MDVENTIRTLKSVLYQLYWLKLGNPLRHTHIVRELIEVNLTASLHPLGKVEEKECRFHPIKSTTEMMSGSLRNEILIPRTWQAHTHTQTR